MTDLTKRLAELQLRVANRQLPASRRSLGNGCQACQLTESIAKLTAAARGAKPSERGKRSPATPSRSSPRRLDSSHLSLVA